MNRFSRFRIAIGEFIAGSTQRNIIQKELDASAAKADIIKAKEAQIVALEKEASSVKTKDNQIAALEREISRLKESTATDTATIKARDDKIAILEGEVASLNGKLKASEVEPQLPASPVTKVAKAKKKVAKGDPYQQIGEDLINALKQTTGRVRDQSQQDE